MTSNPNDEIRRLVERWCDRREYHTLMRVLPAWLGNNGLTDGWAELRDALRNASCHGILPTEERETLKDLYVAIDTRLRESRC